MLDKIDNENFNKHMARKLQPEYDKFSPASRCFGRGGGA